MNIPSQSCGAEPLSSSNLRSDKIQTLVSNKHAVISEDGRQQGAPGGQKVILIVDDEQKIVEVMKEMLETLGYRIFAAGCGQEAVAIYMEKQDKIDLILLDLIMPGMGGGKTFGMLKEINPQAKIILATGYGASREIQGIMAAGCDGFLPKPFKFDTLSRDIRDVLERRGS